VLNKLLYTILFVVSITFNGFAQIIDNAVFSSSGSNNNQLVHTIGEPLINTLSNSSNILTQGFNQTYLTLVSVENLSKDIRTTLYPNPSLNSFKLNIQGVLEPLYVYIYDMKGEKLRTILFENNDHIYVNNLESGTYLILVETKKGKLLSRTKFIKSTSR
jgi:hypothetical protein